MWKVAALAVAAAVAMSAGCGDREVGSGAGPTEEPTPVFAVTAQEISDSIEVPRAIGTNVATGLNTPDRELYVAQFHPGAK